MYSRYFLSPEGCSLLIFLGQTRGLSCAIAPILVSVGRSEAQVGFERVSSQSAVFTVTCRSNLLYLNEENGFLGQFLLFSPKTRKNIDCRKKLVVYFPLSHPDTPDSPRIPLVTNYKQLYTS